MMDGFLAMGGYGGYLLVAYGVTALVIVGNVVAARRQFRRIQQQLREQLVRRDGRRQVSGEGPAANGTRETENLGRPS